MTGKTFKDAYGVLQRHAETLREQTEPNIDDLLTIVTESVDAYKVCKERIDAVEAALKEALGGVGVEPAASSNATARQGAREGQRTSGPRDPEPGDDDMPGDR